MLVIGVDLGGTKIEAVVAERDASSIPLTVLARRRVPTRANEGYDAVIDSAVALIQSIAKDAGVDEAGVPIGMGMPGGTTRRGRLVKNSNATCLNGRPFRDDLCHRLARGVTFDNDANCFALAETLLGAAAPYRAGIVFGVILGTGVGGGVVVEGKVWEGAQGIAGEWGHHAIHPGDRPCYCGASGCVERYVAGPAVEAEYFARTGIRLPLHEIVTRRAADPDAADVMAEFVDAFGRGLANVIAVLDPTAVVVGGGVSNLELLYGEGTARVAHYVFNDELTTPILKNALGDSAGVLGAALIARSP